MKVEKVDIDLFYNTKNLKILIEEDFSCGFWIIELNNFVVGIALNSTVEPQILVHEQFNLLLVGGGASIMAMSTLSGIVKFSLGVSDSFSSFIKIDSGFIIVNETTIININGNTNSLTQFINVPDIIQECKFIDGKYIITGLDSEFVI